jgi:hypothetical protein
MSCEQSGIPPECIAARNQRDGVRAMLFRDERDGTMAF